ncbi:hypothetical protein ACHAQH_007227 [Verticillium albo-atrum]
MAVVYPSINPTPTSDKMAPSTLDLFVLTFNCAKQLINAAVFASHLQAAFKQNATALPEVVVFSLQEVSPLASAFIGGSFVSPYLLAYEEALNLAAAKHGTARPDTDTDGSHDATLTVAPTVNAGPVRPYTLVRARNVGMTAIMLFARDPAALRDVQEAEVGFGANNMGNKGAVALRATFGRGEDETEVTFVATHLAAMEWNLRKRNENWGSIMRGLAFEDPRSVLRESPALTAATIATEVESGNGADDERSRLLATEDDAHKRAQRARLQELSVFKPSAHLFVAGDLNYRISAESPPPNAPFPSLDDTSEHHYPRFFETDQLTEEREAGRTMHGMSEAEVRFPPTYKYHVLDGEDDEGEVNWEFASHRWPSWTDRVLYLDVPGAKDGAAMDVRAYDALPVLRTSDHRPVFLRVGVPMLSAAQMTDALAAAAASAGGTNDPRAMPPVDVDVDAWAARAAARRSEKWAGSTMYLWTTRAGAYAIAGLLGLGIAGYLWVGRSQTAAAA